jgi:adenylate cyclase
MSSGNSFIVGDWTVEPDLDRITRGEEQRMLRPQVMELLVYLAKRSRQLCRSDDLFKDLWPNKVVSDATLYNCVAELRHQLDEGAEGSGSIQTIPKKGYRLLLPVHGLQETDAEKSDSIIHVTGRRLIFLVMSLVCVAVLMLAYENWRATGPPKLSIAVLPFLNMSADPEQEYFSDGMAEELINLLAKIPQLHVTSRSSAFSFKGKDFTMAQVGHELNVDHVLEGSVRRSGDEIRVTVQLIHVSADSPLWSETWEREFENVFEIQDEIAGQVVNALKIQLVDELPHAYVTDPQAYELYLKALPLVDEQTEGSVSNAEALLLQLLEIDPEYAPGLVLLGKSEIFFAGWNFRPMEQSFERARSYGRRAVEAAPTYSGGYVLQARVAYMYDRDLIQASQLLDKAVNLEPGNIGARASSAYLKSLQGDHETMVEIARERVRLDPLSGQPYWQLGYALRVAREYDESAKAFREILAINPDTTAIHAAIGEMLLLAGNYQEALAEFDAEPLDGFTYYGRAMTFHALGDDDQSDTAMEKLISLDDADGWAAQIAGAHAMRGENDEAIKWLYRALEQHDQGVWNSQNDPFFDNLRDDPRFDEFLKGMYSGT